MTVRPLTTTRCCAGRLPSRRAARKRGEHPSRPLLAGPDGTRALPEQGNAYAMKPARDPTAHAERVLATRAGRAYQSEFLSHLHAVRVGRAVRDVRRRDLLGRHRPRRLRPERKRR